MVEAVQGGPVVKSLFGMAFFAVVPEVVLVWVIVAVVAIFKKNPIKMLENAAIYGFFPVAFDALNVFVFSR